MVAALNNRAMARLKLQQWEDAVTDCSAVLALEPRNVKALLRRATAAQALGQGAAAAADWRAVLAAEPRNREAAAGLAQAEAAAAVGDVHEQQELSSHSQHACNN
jgi:tetratricopeptide (TPR) repeat protein